MADKIDDGGPAYPGDEIAYQAFGTDGLSQAIRRPFPGMSIRDWFAGQVAPALLAELYDHSVRSGKQYEVSVFTMGANAAYEFADAMIAARKGGL